MIYYMDTVTLMKKYSKLPIDVIENTNYIIISSRIHVTKNRDNVLVATNMFVNTGLLKGVGMEIDSDPHQAVENFKMFLLREPKPMGLICGLIESYITAGENAVFLCSPNEMKCKYMEIIAAAIEELYGLPVRKFPEEADFDLRDVITRVLYYKKEIKKLTFKQMKPVQIRKYVKALPKKKLKKELKRRDLDYEGLTIEEMQTLLEDNFKEGL